MKSVIIITNIPSVYRKDLFNQLSFDKDLDYSFLFIPDKSVSHKSIIWAKPDNKFFKKSTIFPVSNEIRLFFTLFKFLNKNNFDCIVVGGFPKYFPVLILLKFFKKYKLICWWGGTVLSETNVSRPKFYLRKFSSSFNDGVIHYSKLSRDYYLSLDKKRKSHFILGNNTRDSKAYYANVHNSEVEKKPKEINIITIGFQEHFKNTILILNGMLKLKSLVKENLVLYVIGDGSELENLKDFSHNNDLDVNFIGNLNPEEIYPYYRIADIFVHTSLLDRWPPTYTEALCSGVPILLSNKSGVYDLFIEKYYKDIVFDPTDIDDFTKKLKYLVENPIFREELSANAKQISEKFDGISKSVELTNFILDLWN